MNDPFAMLNPIDKPKTAPVYGGPPAAPVHSVGGGYGGPGAPGMGMNMGGGMGMGMGMNGGGFGGMAPGMGGGMGGMPPGMGGMHPGMGGMPPGMGGMPPGMGGMNPGMGMGMGGQPPQGGQAPIMYDNIKNLLQQKPKPAGAMRDDTSMDFLENLGNGKANSISVTSPTAAMPSASPFGAAVDPFGGPAPAAPTASAPAVSLGTFEFPGESSSSSSASNSVSPSNGGAKSNALADRLANGRRKTQEAQRQQLGFNAGAFTQTTGAPRISLKEMAPQSGGDKGDRGSRAPSLEDFAAGKPVFYESDPFGAPSASSATTVGNSSRTNSRTNSGGSNSHSSKQQSFGSSYSVPSSAPSAFDDNSGGISVDSDADFESKLNGGGSTGSSRNLSSGNLGGARTGSGGSSAASKATMDFGW